MLTTHLWILPVEFANQLQYLVQCALQKDIMQKMLDKTLHGGKFDNFADYTFRRIALRNNESPTRIKISAQTRLIKRVLQHDMISRVKMLSGLFTAHQFDLASL